VLTAITARSTTANLYVTPDGRVVEVARGRSHAASSGRGHNVHKDRGIDLGSSRIHYVKRDT
jgi:hypothetical protein